MTEHRSRYFIIIEKVDDRYVVICSIGMNDQVVSLAAEKGILAIRPRKPQSIISDVGRRSITDHILTVSDGKHKSIQPLVTAKKVIT